MTEARPEPDPDDTPITDTTDDSPTSEDGAAEESTKPLGKGTIIALMVAIAVLFGGGGWLLGAQFGGTTSYALASGGEVTPGGNGSRGDGPVPQEDGNFDASIVGPGGPLNTQADIVNVHRRDEADPFAIGAIDAPIVISEFSDTECSYCALFANETLPQLMETYVDTGLVRIEWNDMPINGESSIGGAKALRAAAEQGRFEEFTRELYANHPEDGSVPEFTIDDFVTFAENAGVADIEQFREHATDETFDAAIDEAIGYGQQIGVNGTPSFLVGSQFVSGAQPFDVFERVIIGELAVIGHVENQEQ